MKILRFFAVASAIFFIAQNAVAQNAGTVTNHAFLIGKGAGTAGYTSLLCPSGQFPMGQTSADPQCVAASGDATISAAGVVAIGANKVTNAQFRQSGALALVGRSANSTGNVADIQATAASSCVFQENASALVCASLGTSSIAANAVTNAKLATMAAYTLKGNNSGSSATPGDIDVTALTLKAAPVSGDIVLIQDSAASNAFKKTTVGAIATAGSVSSLNSKTGVLTLSLAKQSFTANGTYTPTTGMIYAIIECQGPGGGGGGVAGVAGSGSSGGAGSAGGYSRTLASAATIGVSQTVTVGTFGAGGVAGNNAGSNGSGSTSVGTLCIANAGNGGGASTSGTSAGAASAGATAATGDLAIPGSPGFGGFNSTITTVVISGPPGANSMFGAGGIGRSTSGAGSAASGFGAGGAPAVELNTAANAAGGNGSSGVVFITEYLLN